MGFRYILTFIAIVFSVDIYGCPMDQISGGIPSVEVPILPKKISSWSDLRFKDWDIKETIYGDINKDKIADLIVYLEENKTLGEMRECGKVYNFDPNPITIAIYIKNTQNDYDLVTQDYALVHKHYWKDSSSQNLRSINISNNIINIKIMPAEYSSFNSVKDGIKSITSLHFRKEESCIKLIGLDYEYSAKDNWQHKPYFERQKTVSINAITGKYFINELQFAKSSIKRGRLKNNPLFCLGEFQLDHGFPIKTDKDEYHSYDVEVVAQ